MEIRATVLLHPPALNSNLQGRRWAPSSAPIVLASAVYKESESNTGASGAPTAFHGKWEILRLRKAGSMGKKHLPNSKTQNSLTCRDCSPIRNSSTEFTGSSW